MTWIVATLAFLSCSTAHTADATGQSSALEAGAMILETDFAPTRAVAVLHIHSLDDPRALYSGGLGPPFPLTSNRVMHRAVVDGLDRWIENNGCGSVPDTLDRKRGRPGSDSADHTATWLSWAPCAGFDVAHWKLSGAGHGPLKQQPSRRCPPLDSTPESQESPRRFLTP